MTGINILKKLKWPSIILSAFLYLSPSSSSGVEGSVRLSQVTVIDGDTLLIKKRNDTVEKVELYCADAFELQQPGGREAKDKLISIIKDNIGDSQTLKLGKRLIDESTGKIFIEIFAGDANIGLELIREGEAIVNSDLCFLNKLEDFSGYDLYEEAQIEAQDTKKGYIWNVKTPLDD